MWLYILLYGAVCISLTFCVLSKWDIHFTLSALLSEHEWMKSFCYLFYLHMFWLQRFVEFINFDPEDFS